MSTGRSFVRLAGFTLLATGLAIALLRAGGGGLGAPPVLHPGDLWRWAAGRDTATMTLAIVRFVALVAAWYLVAVCAVHLATAGSRARPLARVAALVTLPMLRRCMAVVAGASLTATTLALAPASAAPAPPPGNGRGGGTAPATSAPAAPAAQLRRIRVGDAGTATLRQVPPVGRTSPTSPPTRPSKAAGATAAPEQTGTTGAPDTAAPTPPTRAGSGTASMRRRPRGPTPTATLHLGSAPAPSASAPRAPARPAPAPSRTAPSMPVAASDAAPPRWTARPGDTLWGIAGHVLEWTWRRPPSDAEIATYLPKLIAANATRLASPGHPELIYPGQQFVLPPPG